MPTLSGKGEHSLLVIHTGKRTTKLNWRLHHPQSGSHIKEKEPRIGITCKNKQKPAIRCH